MMSKQLDEKILHSDFVPTQFDLILDDSFKKEVESAMAIVKNEFVKNNKEYLFENNYSVKVDGFLIDETIYKGIMKLQIRIVNSNNQDVVIDFSKLKLA